MPLDKQEARILGQLLCQTTLEVLWQPALDRIQQRRPGAKLECRVGSGQATYHRFDPRDRRHCITYGARMIVAKYRADTARGWLSSREIESRGYFGGKVSTRNLLAHTCCHEFAHLLQQTAGQRYRGSVHNRYFYGILDELHADGSAREVSEHLSFEARRSGLHLPETTFVRPEPVAPPIQWQTGDQVSFTGRGKTHSGIIERINRKTCTVLGNGRSRGTRYRVPFSLLRHGDL